MVPSTGVMMASYDTRNGLINTPGTVVQSAVWHDEKHSRLDHGLSFTRCSPNRRAGPTGAAAPGRRRERQQYRSFQAIRLTWGAGQVHI
jgi:hypothetical protein